MTGNVVVTQLHMGGASMVCARCKTPIRRRQRRGSIWVKLCVGCFADWLREIDKGRTNYREACGV